MLKKFTLIELLVVLAVLGILLSLLLPSLKAARTKAKKAVCLNQTAQMNRAFLANSKNHNDRPFWDTQTGDNGQFPNTITRRNAEEINLPKEIYYCPVKLGYDTDGAWEHNASYRVVNYSFTFKRPNGGISQRSLVNQNWVEKFSLVENPAEDKFIIDDTVKRNGAFDWITIYGQKTNHYSYGRLDQSSSFVDGHAKITSLQTWNARLDVGGNKVFWW
ncbi:MAG: prepilin-type N-terminal cleavage/methylation domain-containing protein [Lentisphaeraceae bacterium]|nr:prepilin-type N-terminal cleavage/methylation domain-containing protein [Lentisphaeraceae bacterium]